MKSTAPSSSRCAEVAPIAAVNVRGLAAGVACAALLTLGGCQTTKKVAPPPVAPAPVPGFVCDTSAQEILCSNETLARLDMELTNLHRRNFRRLDGIGREQLVAAQNRWLIGRASACAAPTLRLDPTLPPPPALLACLIGAYAERIAVLREWPAITARAASQATPATAHPVSAYVEFRPAGAGSADPQLCAALANAFNAGLRAHGTLDIARNAGMSLIAGTHGAARTAGYAVEVHEAGPYAGHALRARTLKGGDGRLLLDENSLGQWIRRLPNHGGRPNSAASQTGDYASIDVFRTSAASGRTLALVAEPWGKYAPGAQGEWAYAGVYQLDGVATPAPLCLYRTYMTPPLKNALDALPAYQALQAALMAIHGPASRELVGRDLHDDHLFRMEQQWATQNMPLLALGEARRNGWSGWLRKRHDAVLDALFAWSERSLHNKTAYRRLLTLPPVAASELIELYQRTQRLSIDDARDAADLALMRLLARYASDLPGATVVMPNAPLPEPAGTGYTPKYPLLATEEDIQRERAYSGLYSAALNGADAEVIADYLRYEYADPQTRAARLTRGVEGETALMAAVTTPAIVRQLLAAGMSANEADARGRTPLMNAAFAGQTESARLLIEAGANVGARSKAGAAACQMIDAKLPAADRAALQGLLCK